MANCFIGILAKVSSCFGQFMISWWQECFKQQDELRKQEWVGLNELKYLY